MHTRMALFSGIEEKDQFNSDGQRDIAGVEDQ
jgi:hypothetical protein